MCHFLIGFLKKFLASKIQKFQFSRTFPRGLFFSFFSNRLKSTPNNWNAPKMTVVKKQNDRYPKWPLILHQNDRCSKMTVIYTRMIVFEPKWPLFIPKWPLFLEIKVTVIWTNHSDGESRKFMIKMTVILQKWPILITKMTVEDSKLTTTI